MKILTRTSRFKKDVKVMKKRGKDFADFKSVIHKLASGDDLEEKFRDHKLIGNYAGTRECHIEPDWLLIYKMTSSELILIRTGTHADLYG